MEDLPRRLQLRQLVWSDGSVWVVEYPISRPHENTVGYISGEFPQCGEKFGAADISGDVNGQQVTFQPDFSYGPGPNVPGIHLAQGAVFGTWTTVIVEVMHTQEWSTIHLKLPMYQELDRLQYIFLLKMSPDLLHWSYEFYDMGNNDFNHPTNPFRNHPAHQFEFDVTTQQQYVVRFDTRRVLGLPDGVQLPPGFPHDDWS